MENPSYIVLSQQMGLRNKMDVIANNLANINTPGFREERILFNQYLTNKATNPGVRGDGARVSFLGVAGTSIDSSDGPLQTTGSQLDFALKGPGFFVINTPAGQRYTRDGHFGIDGQGRLVNRDGFTVLDSGGQPMNVPQGASTFEITPTGTLTTDKGPVGTLQIVKFDNEAALQKAGAGLYQTDAQSQPVDNNTAVQQGVIEGSNVQPITEVTRMIDVQRSYEAAQQLLSDEHNRDLQAIQILTRTN